MSKLKLIFSMKSGKVKEVMLKLTSEMKICGGRLKMPVPEENFNKESVFFRFGLEILICPGKNSSEPSISAETNMA